MNLMTVFFLQAPAAGPDGSMMWIMLIAMFAIMSVSYTHLRAHET